MQGVRSRRSQGEPPEDRRSSCSASAPQSSDKLRNQDNHFGYRFENGRVNPTGAKLLRSVDRDRSKNLSAWANRVIKASGGVKCDVPIAAGRSMNATSLSRCARGVEMPASMKSKRSPSRVRKRKQRPRRRQNTLINGTHSGNDHAIAGSDRLWRDGGWHHAGWESRGLPIEWACAAYPIQHVGPLPSCGR